MENEIIESAYPARGNVMIVMGAEGRERALACYEHAVRERYRFFSFGDAMFIEGRRAPYDTREA